MGGQGNRRSQNLRLSVNESCTEDWASMAGTDALRYCGKCRSNVYNLSAMTQVEVERLLAAPEGLCVRYSYRPDGTLVRSDCTRARPRTSSKLALGMAASLSYPAAFAGLQVALGEEKPARHEAQRDGEGIRVAMGGMKLRIPRPEQPTAAEEPLTMAEFAPSLRPLVEPEARQPAATAPTAPSRRAQLLAGLAGLLSLLLLLVSGRGWPVRWSARLDAWSLPQLTAVGASMTFAAASSLAAWIASGAIAGWAFGATWVLQRRR